MPLYEFRCDRCGFVQEIVVPVEHRDNTQLCFNIVEENVVCGGTLIRIISPPTIRVKHDT